MPPLVPPGADGVGIPGGVFAAAHDTAIKRHGEGEDALREAYGELKHDFDLETDHWVPKQG